MQLSIKSITHNRPVPDEFAFCVPDPQTRVTFAANRNPGVSWRDVPKDTKSLILICVDTDAPSRPDDVNKSDREVPAGLPRADFYHWIMVDIPPTLKQIEEAACAKGVVSHGKLSPAGPAQTRQGLNDYTSWFADDNDMAGDYFGYDGPCPPWNDARIHQYHFRLLAIDLERCPVEGPFSGSDVMQAVAGHILEQTEVVASYTLNPRLRD